MAEVEDDEGQVEDEDDDEGVVEEEYEEGAAPSAVSICGSGTETTSTHHFFSIISM